MTDQAPSRTGSGMCVGHVNRREGVFGGYVVGVLTVLVGFAFIVEAVLQGRLLSAVGWCLMILAGRYFLVMAPLAPLRFVLDADGVEWVDKGGHRRRGAWRDIAVERRAWLVPLLVGGLLPVYQIGADREASALIVPNLLAMDPAERRTVCQRLAQAAGAPRASRP